jgi:hypothetical protein
LKCNLAEVKKKLVAIVERFVIGEFDRNLYDKLRPNMKSNALRLNRNLIGAEF